MAENREVAINYCMGDTVMSVTAGDNKWRNKILKWAKEFPDDVAVRYVNNDGTILAYMPVRWFKLSPPRKMSEERKIENAARLAAAKGRRDRERDGT